jgi:hypothetical protein
MVWDVINRLNEALTIAEKTTDELESSLLPFRAGEVFVITSSSHDNVPLPTLLGFSNDGIDLHSLEDYFCDNYSCEKAFFQAHAEKKRQGFS